MTLIVLAEPRVSVRDTLAEGLRERGFQVIVATIAELVKEAERRSAAMIIVGPSLANIPQLRELGQQVQRGMQWLPLLLLVPSSSEELAVAALRAGVREYIAFPCDSSELAAAVRQCLRNCGASDGRSTAVSSRSVAMIGDSRPMQDVKASLSRAALTDSNVLITGETGTGKELAAEFLHRQSPRRSKPFVALNCAAIPDSLLESELFGYERGAFTGAQSSKEGKLKDADGGTVFLDEIGDMSPFAQAKVLRLIDGKEIQRLGGSGILVNVRIVAATNQELETLVHAEKFRKDLYFRLNVARVHLPPLRERKEDIPSIVNYYVKEFNNRFGRSVERLTDTALECFLAHEWPGNIRELKNLLETIFIHISSAEISVGELPRWLCENRQSLSSVPGDERERLVSALVSTNWNKSKAADKLRWSRMTLYRKMAKHRVAGAGN